MLSNYALTNCPHSPGKVLGTSPNPAQGNDHYADLHYRIEYKSLIHNQRTDQKVKRSTPKIALTTKALAEVELLKIPSGYLQIPYRIESYL